MREYKQDKQLISFLLYLQIKHSISFSPVLEYDEADLTPTPRHLKSQIFSREMYDLIYNELNYVQRDDPYNGAFEMHGREETNHLSVLDVPHTLWCEIKIDPKQIDLKLLDSKLLNTMLLNKDNEFTNQAEDIIKATLLTPAPESDSLMAKDTCSIVVNYYRIFPRLPARTTPPITTKSNSSEICMIL